MPSVKMIVRRMFQKIRLRAFLNGFNLGIEQSNNMNNPNAHTERRSMRAPISKASHGKGYPEGL
jgi:hypothetical protein